MVRNPIRQLLRAVGVALRCPLLVTKAAPGRRSSRVRIVGEALLAVGPAVVALPLLLRPAARLETAALFRGPYVGHETATATADCAGCPEADELPTCAGTSFDGEYV